MNTAHAQKTSPINKKPLFGRGSRLFEFLVEKSIAGVAFISFAFIILIFVFVFREAFPLVTGRAIDDFGSVNLLHLLSLFWQPVSNHPTYGLLPLFVGSLKVTLIAVAIAGPVAIFAALFTSAFAPKWAKEIMKPCIEILAGIPSVVIGFFALTVLASFVQNAFGLTYRLNAFTGGLALSLAVIPIIFTVAEDSLSVLPNSMREASYALGATKWETAAFVLLPAALPGVFAAILLGIGRAFGETMIVLMATGNSALLSPDLFESVRTMSATIGAEMAEVVFGDAHYNILFFIGIVLFAFSFSLNFFAEFVVRKYLMRRFAGRLR
ncbi:MAG: phosphate ABC transporter permease subunit PstC [Chitinispirillaceae bacterium]|jgi:phosphate transport system permease protein|nr:phosphate ABC transporter permease subunit PstC [Chitinispirillaceae bacterium]